MGCSLISCRIFVDQVAIFSSIPKQHLTWSYLWQKIGNSWNIVDCCCQELSLKCDRAPRSDSVAKKALETCQVYSKFLSSRMSLASLFNFEHISHFILLLLLQNSNRNTVWVGEYIISDNKFGFSNCEKYIGLWAKKMIFIHPN